MTLNGAAIEPLREVGAVASVRRSSQNFAGEAAEQFGKAPRVPEYNRTIGFSASTEID